MGVDTIFAIFICALVPMAWFDYLLQADLFHRENLRNILIVFHVCLLTPILIFPMHKFIIQPLGISQTGNLLLDFLYDVFVIGLPEEALKIIPVYIFMKRWKKIVNEPSDILLYAAVSALAFSFLENTLYAWRYGYLIITHRGIIAAPLHVFFSTIAAYGIMRYEYRFGKITELIGYFWMAVLFHGFYDFILISDIPYGIIISTIIFLCITSLFAGMLNNALNQSPYFTETKVIPSGRMTRRLFIWYSMFYLLYLLGLFIINSEKQLFTLSNLLLISFTKHAFLLLIIIMRIGRFVLKRGIWEKLKLELPFYITSDLKIVIKGEGMDETWINQFLYKSVVIHPASKKQMTFSALVKDKFYFHNYNFPTYLLETNSKHTSLYLMPKINRITKFSKQNPVFGLFKNKSEQIPSKPADLQFIEWVTLTQKN